jgi:hypothetical protein
MPSSSSQNSDEPPGLLKILGAVFSGVLFGVFLSKLKTPVQDPVETIHPQNSTDNRQTEAAPPSPLAVAIESYPPPSVSEEEKSDKKRERFYRRGSLVASIATVLITLGILCVTYRYTKYAGGQLQTMKGQLQTMQAQMELQERPWIKIVNVETRGNNPMVPALSFQDAHNDFEHKLQATFQLKVSIKNIGHSVAEIAVRPEVFFPLWDNFGKSVPDEQKRFCDSDFGKARSGYYPSIVLFPDESFDWYGAGAQFIDSSNTTHIGNTAYVLPVAIVCTNYRLESLPNTYQTSVVYEVFRKDNNTRFFEPGVGTPASKIFMIRDALDDRAY